MRDGRRARPKGETDAEVEEGTDHPLYRIRRYRRALTKVQGEVSHWNEEIRNALEATVVGIVRAELALGVWPKDEDPPRKTRVWKWQRIAVGDFVRVTKRAKNRSPTVLRDAQFKVVAVEDGMVQVQHDGVVYGVIAKSLEPAEEGD